jgi:glycosyltransferase involved in cell wall biosynthesis
MARVLFTTLGLNLSGQSVHVANLGKGLERLGWNLAIATGDLAEGQPLGREFFLDRGFEVDEIPFSGWGLGLPYVRDQYRSARALRKLIASYRPDVIHIHSATLAPVVRAARPGHRTPAVVTTLNNERIEGSKQFFARAASRVTRHPLGERVIAISNAMRELAIRTLRISPALIRNIDCSVDDEHFRLPTHRERAAARSFLGLSPQDFVVCCVGRLEPNKNQESLIRAAALLQASGISVRVVFAGQSIGDYGCHLARIAAEHDLAEATSFPGFVDARTVYWASDANVLPSKQEGFGLVVIEGILCGTLAIRSNSAGAGDQIEDKRTGLENKRTGLLIDANSTDSIAAALHLAMTKPVEVSRMRRAAHQRVARRFTLDRMARQVARIYAEAIACAHAARV